MTNGHPEHAHESLVIDAPSKDQVERLWRAYWMPLLMVDGRISMPKLKGELYDAYFLVDNARRVYHHVTAGATDRLTASAEGIIAMAERVVERRVENLEVQVADLKAQLERARKE